MNRYKYYIVGDNINKHSLLSVAGIIENSSVFNLIDLKMVKIEEIAQLEEIKDNSVFLFSILSGQIPQISRSIQLIKKKNKHAKLISGGALATGAPELCIEMGFDFVIRHEAEKALPMLLESIHKNKDYSDIPNLSYQVQGEIRANPKSGWINLDNAYNYSRTFQSGFPIEITRGCPYGCKFCQVRGMFGAKPRHRSIDSILSYIRPDQEYVRFISPNALSYGSNQPTTINYDKIEELLYKTRMIRSDMQLFFSAFPSEVRPEFINSETIRLIKKYTDNKAVAIGAQSGSDRMLKLINRQHTTGDVYQALELIHKNKLSSRVDFIFGMPDESEEDINSTLKFIEKIIKFNTTIRIHTFMPLPGTAFQDQPIGTISPKVRKFLYKLIGKGIGAGPWMQKEKINHSLSNFFQTKKNIYKKSLSSG